MRSRCRSLSCQIVEVNPAIVNPDNIDRSDH